MASKQVQIIGQFYADESRPWSSQDCCNYIPVQAEAEGTLTQWRLRDAPGPKPFVEIIGAPFIEGNPGAEDPIPDTPAVPAGPIRGMRNVEGKLLVVAGTQLYQISPTGVAIPRGNIPGTGMVQMSHNQVAGGNQVFIANGVAGYIYNTSTLVLAKITDPGFPGSIAAAYLDSYFLGVDPAGRFWFHSDLADGFNYNTLDRYESEARPDRIVTLAVSAEEVVVFNQQTTEFFVNTGAATGTFQSKGITLDVGCASRNGVVLLDNSLMWLDDHGIFQRMNGYGAQPISNRVIERAVSAYDWASVVAYTYEDKGHKIAYWTFRDGITLGFDVTTGKWHRRASYGLDRWRMTSIVEWNRKWYAGDFQTGRIWELDWDYKLDGTDPLVRRYVSGPIWNEQRRFGIPSAELVFDTGGPVTVPVDFPAQPEGPTITGAAPDVVLDEPYTFTYTVTAGDAPIAQTEITSGALLAGLTWDEATATISGTPTVTGTMTLEFRTTDTSGLYDDHADVIEVDYLHDFVAKSSTLLMFGSADAWTDSVSLTVGSRVETWGGRVLVIDVLSIRYSDDYFATETLVTVPWASATSISRPVKTSGGRIYVAVGDANVYYTDDGGATWGSIDTGDTAISRVAGDDEHIIAARSNATFYVCTDGATFGAAKTAPASIASLGYGAGMFMFGTALSTSYYWTEDAGDTFTAVTVPNPGSDPIESTNSFRTSSGAWLLQNRINTATAANLIARSPDGKAAFAYVTTPSLKLDGGSVDCFAERGGEIVAYAQPEGDGIAMAFLKSTDDGEGWTRVDHGYAAGAAIPLSIASFPTGSAK